MITLLAIGRPLLPSWADLRPFSAALWIIITLVSVLLAPFFARRSNALCAALTLGGLGMALLSMLIIGIGPDVAGTHLGGMLVADPFATLWNVMLLIFVMGIVLLWISTAQPTLREGDGPEFFVLLLGATLGMSLMASTSNLLMIFIVIELASLPSYVLAGFRKTHRKGAEASLKYVLFGAACSAVMVYGLSLLYGLCGTLRFDGPHGVAARIAAGAGSGEALLAAALFALMVGIGFKIAAFPFHWWCPDVFEGAGVEVSAFLSVASKGAGLMLLMRLLMLVASACGFAAAPAPRTLAIAIGVLGALTATIGNLAAYVQNSVKRILAYSSIAHAGYMLCIAALLVDRGGNHLVTAALNQPAEALLLYLAVYLFMNLGAFAVAGLMVRHGGGDDLSDYAGLGRRAPILAACMACCLISLVGLPPFAGFAAKVNAMWVLAHNGGWWWALVGVIVVNTVLSLYYYFRVLRAMYLTPSDAPAFNSPPLGTALCIVCAVMLVIMLLFLGPLLGLTTRYAHIHGVISAGAAGR